MSQVFTCPDGHQWEELFATGQEPGPGQALSREQRAKAEREYHQAKDLFSKLAADFSSVPAYRMELANTYNSLAAVRATAKDWLAAESGWRQAADVFEGLVRTFPTNADYQGRLGLALANLGWLMLQRHESEKARPLLERAQDHLETALKPNPDNPTYRRGLRWVQRNLAQVKPAP